MDSKIEVMDESHPGQGKAKEAKTDANRCCQCWSLSCFLNVITGFGIVAIFAFFLYKLTLPP
jgi:hypothetical protein